MPERNRQGFASSSAVLFLIMMVGNVLNYIFQLAMGRLLSISEYGALNALLSYMTIVGTPSVVLQAVVSFYSARFAAGGQQARIRPVMRYALRLSLCCAAAFAAFSVLFSAPLCGLLKLALPQLLLAAAAAAVTCFAPVLAGALQGTKRFTDYGIQGDIAAAVKLGLGAALVLCGLGAAGPVISVAAGSALAFWYSVRKLRALPDDGAALQQTERTQLLRFAANAFLVQLCSTLLQSGDVLLVKAVAAPEQAGVYASGSVIAKIALYVSGAVTAVLFPLVTQAAEKGERTRPLLLRALLYGGAPALLYCAALNLFGEKLIGLFFGERYLAAVGMLLPTCALVLSVTLLVIELNYYLALGKTRFFVVSVAGGCLLIALLAFLLRPQLEPLLYLMSAVLFAAFLLNLAYAYRDKEKTA